MKTHVDAIDVALIDALHAFSNRTGRAEAYHDPDAEQCHQDPSSLSRVAPLTLSTQTCEAADLDFLLPQIINRTANDGDFSPWPMSTGHGHFSLI